MTILLQHTFTSADSATSIPSADTGQATEVLLGTWGVNANRAYKVSSGTAVVVWETGQSNVQITVDRIFNTTGNRDGQIAFRVTNSSNFFIFRWNSNVNELQVYKFVSGTGTKIASKAKALSNGVTYTFKVVLNDSSVECYLDDVLEFSLTDTFNQTATKHGFRQFENSAEYYDNFLVESLTTGGDTGTDGSTLFDVKQVIYQDSTLSADTKQSLYADETLTTDLLQRIYSDEYISSDTKQAIYSDGYTQADTKQILYELSSTAFDTLQEYYEDGQIGSTPFDMRMVLYSDGSTVFDSSQAYYESGSVNVDLKQAIYESGQSTGDMRLIIYADEAVRSDLKQLLYSDAYTSFDTKQVLYDAETQVIGVIKLKGKRELYVYLKGKRELEVHLKGGLNVTVVNENFTMEAGDNKELVFDVGENFAGSQEISWELYNKRSDIDPFIKISGYAQNNEVRVPLIPNDTKTYLGRSIFYELIVVDPLQKKSTLTKGMVTFE